MQQDRLKIPCHLPDSEKLQNVTLCQSLLWDTNRYTDSQFSLCCSHKQQYARLCVTAMEASFQVWPPRLSHFVISLECGQMADPSYIATVESEARETGMIYCCAFRALLDCGYS